MTVQYVVRSGSSATSRLKDEGLGLESAPAIPSSLAPVSHDEAERSVLRHCRVSKLPLWKTNTYRIIDWQGLEGTLKIIWFQTPCHEQGHLPPAQSAQSPIQPGLGHCQGGGSHSFSGQPVPVFHHPHGEEFLPNI